MTDRHEVATFAVAMPTRQIKLNIVPSRRNKKYGDMNMLDHFDSGQFACLVKGSSLTTREQELLGRTLRRSIGEPVVYIFPIRRIGHLPPVRSHLGVLSSMDLPIFMSLQLTHIKRLLSGSIEPKEDLLYKWAVLRPPENIYPTSSIGANCRRDCTKSRCWL